MRIGTFQAHAHMLSLPPQAFIPKRHLEVQERHEFIEKRDRLFALCTPAEQQCLIKLARWYGAQRHQLLQTPNIFSDSFAADFHYRYLPWMHSKPSATVRGLAKVSQRITAVDQWLGNRLQRSLIAQLETMRHRGEVEVLMGVANYLRALPLQLGWDVQRALEEQLEEVAQKCASSKNGDPKKRMDSLIRSIRAAPNADNAANLRSQIWPVLLEVAEQDIAAGLQLIDAHWESKQEPSILFSLYLHEVPELAYRLAVVFQPHRPVFATEMMGESLMCSSFQYDKIEEPERAELEQIMDASCQLLASWTESLPRDEWSASLRSIDSLLRYGNPTDEYWANLPGAALEIIKGLDHVEQRKLFRLMAQIPFYSDSGSSQEMEGLDLFDACAKRALAMSEGETSAPEDAAYDICGAMSILENKTRSYRNRRIEANPNHPLLCAFEIRLQDVLERVVVRAPQSALQNTVALALALSNQVLVRKLHQILRKQFEQRARAFPADAGKALEGLIKYRYFSHSLDEMYLSEICQETFDLLVPTLDGISSADAAVARSGIGWNPRNEYM